jgi:hypothetical protein
MGLEGTLKVFSLNDIFQMLGLQRKTGVLTVESDEDTITISFLGGQVVAADSTRHRLDNRIGQLLVRAGRIREDQLAGILQSQKDSRQRLGFLLVGGGLVSPEDLREVLRLQIQRIVFSALRWSDGRFRFSQEAEVDYDSDHMSPVATESMMMEAAQILDEFPRLEKKIRSRELVFRRAPGSESVRLVVAPQEEKEGALAVSKAEAESWRWIDGKRSVKEILERAFLSEFDVYRGLAELLERNLIVEGRAPERVPAQAQAPAPARKRERERISARRALPLTAVALWALALAMVAAGAYLVSRNSWNLLLRPAGNRREVAEFLKSVSLGRLASIERAVRVFYDSSGQYPKSLEDLVSAHILDPAAVVDPYGRKYRYILRSDDGKFGLYGRNVAGEIDLDLSFDRALAPVAERHPANSRTRRQERRPAVQVIE